VAYTLNVTDIDKLINAFVSSAMVEEAACISVDALLTSEKDAFSKEIMQNAQAKLSSIDSGVMISVVELTNVSMPNELKETYNNVNAASVYAATQIEQAKSYRENLLPSAEADKATMIAKANSERATAISAANTALAEFWGVAEEAKQNPELVKSRIYYAKFYEICAKIKKVYGVQDDGSKIVIGAD
jgi:membrane protease subunit HflK